jgi:hypothetical protein
MMNDVLSVECAYMHLFVLVLFAVAAFYPLARRPALRPFAFCAMMLAYTGVGAVWWTEHDCHFNAPAHADWTLARLVPAARDVTCKSDPRPQFAALMLTSAY